MEAHEIATDLSLMGDDDVVMELGKAQGDAPDAKEGVAASLVAAQRRLERTGESLKAVEDSLEEAVAAIGAAIASGKDRGC